MLFGSVPRPPKKPRSSMSTQSARHAAARNTTVTRSTARRVEGGERADPGGQEPRLLGLRHRGRYPGQGAGAPMFGPLPETAAGPGLQYRHPGEEHAHDGKHGAAEPGTAPVALRQGDEHTRGAVEARRTRGAEQPRQPRGE